jgi:hypothetical protein
VLGGSLDSAADGIAPIRLFGNNLTMTELIVKCRAKGPVSRGVCLAPRKGWELH